MRFSGRWVGFVGLLAACGSQQENDTGQVSPTGAGQSGAAGSTSAAGASAGGQAGGTASGAGGTGVAGMSGGSGGKAAGAGGVSAGGKAGQAGGGGTSTGGVAGQGGAGLSGSSGQSGGGTAGAGGSAAGAAGGGAGGSGSSGAAGFVVCDVLVQTGAPVEMAFESWMVPSHPALEVLNTGQVVVAASTVPNESPGPVAPTLRFSQAVDALGPWPSSPIGLISPTVEQAGSSYVMRPHDPVPGSFSVTYTAEAGSGLIGPSRSQALDPGGMNFIPLLHLNGPWPVLLARPLPESKILVGLDVALLPDHHRLWLNILDYEDPAQAQVAPYGCSAGTPLRADAYRVGDQFLIATSSSRDPMKCDTDDGVDGPPTRVQIFRQGATVADVTSTFEMDLKSPVRLVQLLPRPPIGAWLVTGVSDDGYGLPLNMIPVMNEGYPGAALIKLTDGAVLPTVPAVASMDAERVAVAYIEQGGQVPHLRLRAASTSGSAQTEVLGADFPKEVAIASPSPDTVVVAWTENSFTAGKLLVARYQCKPAE